MSSANVQLRPKVTFVPTLQFPGYDPTQPVTTIHYSPDYTPIDQDHTLYSFTITEPLVADGDVKITYTCRAHLNVIGAYLESFIGGIGGSIAVGDMYTPIYPDRPFVWLGGNPENPAPACPEEPAEKTLTIDRNQWNNMIAGFAAEVWLMFSLEGLPVECDDSFVQVYIEYKTPGAPEEYVYTSPAHLGLRSFAPTLVGCNTTQHYKGTWRYKWAEWVIDPHTCTFRPRVVSESRNGGDEAYDMVSLGGINVSPEEETDKSPGKCSTVFPMQGHVRGAVVRIMGVGECKKIPVP